MRSDASNLPEFPGAAQVYARCEMICSKLNAAAYEAQRAASARRKFRFHPAADAESIIKAMNRGDEEALKAATFEHRNLWLA